MIFYVLDNLKINNDDKIFIIYYNLENYNFESIINNKYPFINFIKLYKQTKEASETIKIGLEHIIKMSNNKKCLLLDCNTFYTQDINRLYKNLDTNAVFYTYNYDPKPLFSYINLDNNNIINKIIEKVKISDNANTGIYCFNDINELYNYACQIVDSNINFNGECYTSCIIDKMITDDKIFKGIELDNKYVFNLGTPEQLN